MAGGLAALLDDIAALAKLAAASVDDVGAAAGRASAKAAGVVIDDTAVTPRYVHGFTPDRELPIIRRIAVGSLRNKLLFILPAALLLSQFLPWLLTPILMVGGAYLSYEGAEKIWELVSGHAKEHTSTPVAAQGADTSVWLTAVEPAPPTGRFWHDRVERPTHLLPTTRTSDRDRARAWAWLQEAAGLDRSAAP